MKKIEINRMKDIQGGLACGWVGVLGMLSIGSPVGVLVGATSGLYSEVRRCWNS